MNLSHNFTQIILAIIALIAAVGITLGVKIIRNKDSKKTNGNDNSNNTTISKNKAKGDIAGRDIKK
ncbi:hypothetical protein [Pedobacter sp. UYP1]|uniref:hypothetical protein n=1 Tax=Pedobacter sp. UYP1 TaxID=1756396 RepID=UPI003394C9DB